MDSRVTGCNFAAVSVAARLHSVWPLFDVWPKTKEYSNFGPYEPTGREMVGSCFIIKILKEV